ncbi:chloramphenicol acetyltransferase [Aliivibrio fischeri SR5]|uniref:Chloramphenicol acetyltransferase n=1 Tax=Aliivibrio fischeri SR5 TaxID=1088719 RepID=A0AAV3EXQ1_ALIFS|nr:chloramphenicol acetyltransferase [Aliivibrio fischeri SR5]
MVLSPKEEVVKPNMGSIEKVIDISDKFFGFKVGKYCADYEQFWHQFGLIKSIGSFCNISNDNVTIVGNHPTSLVSTNTFLYRKNVGYFE